MHRRTILATLMERLSIVWTYFLYSKQIPGTNVPSDYLATPCPPAPGRRLLIIRTDPTTQPNSGTLLTLDEIAKSPDVITGRRRSNSWMDKVGSAEWRPESSTSTDSNDSTEADDQGTGRRWSLLRNVIGATSRARSQSPSMQSRGGAESPTSGGSGRSSPAPRSTPIDQPQSGDFRQHRQHTRQRSGSMPAAPRVHRTFCFKFSLEYVDRRFQTHSAVALNPPRLPLAAQQHLMSKYNLTAMFADSRPTAPPKVGVAAGCGTYAGRALAEWSGVVNECQSFFDRRIREGVPGTRFVETPLLGVETFKRPG